jgi:hypothetical protein
MFHLLDYRRQVNAMYTMVRNHGAGGAGICTDFRRRKDELFRTHIRSPLTAQQRARFTGLRYARYDPAYAITTPIDLDVKQSTFQVDLGDDGLCTLRVIGRVDFTLPSGSGSLNVYWIEGYGGGLFLPFRDATAHAAGDEATYGGGRYLFDTIKGADLGGDAASLILDFNYAYNPSCAYDPRWVCPLAPPENVLDFPIPVGELAPHI